MGESEEKLGVDCTISRCYRAAGIRTSVFIQSASERRQARSVNRHGRPAQQGKKKAEGYEGSRAATTPAMLPWFLRGIYTSAKSRGGKKKEKIKRKKSDSIAWWISWMSSALYLPYMLFKKRCSASLMHCLCVSGKRGDYLEIVNT